MVYTDNTHKWTNNLYNIYSYPTEKEDSVGKNLVYMECLSSSSSSMEEKNRIRNRRGGEK
jgi:hypothetical protein